MKVLNLVLLFCTILACTSLFAIESTGSQPIDEFFSNVEKISTGIENVRGKINQVNSYVIWALNDPNDYNANITGKSYADACAYATTKYANQPSVTLNTANFRTVMTMDNLTIFIDHVSEAQKELIGLSADLATIGKNAQELIDNAKVLPAEAKKLKPLKVPKVISGINNSVKQLQTSMEGVKAITAVIPISIQLVTAIIGGKNADIQIVMTSANYSAFKAETNKANANNLSQNVDANNQVNNPAEIPSSGTVFQKGTTSFGGMISYNHSNEHGDNSLYLSPQVGLFITDHFTADIVLIYFYRDRFEDQMSFGLGSRYFVGAAYAGVSVNNQVYLSENDRLNMNNTINFKSGYLQKLSNNVYADFAVNYELSVNNNAESSDGYYNHSSVLLNVGLQTFAPPSNLKYSPAKTAFVSGLWFIAAGVTGFYIHDWN